MVIGKDIVWVGIFMVGWLALGSLLTGAMWQELPVRLVLANILLVAGRYFFQSKRLYWQTTGIFLAIGVSVLIIGVISNINMELKLAVNSEIFIICLAETITILPNCIEMKYVRLLLSLILWGGFISIACLFWLYYIAENAWLGYEAILAIIQTNSAEAADYIQMHNIEAMVFLIVLSLAMLTILGYQIMQNRCLRRLDKKMRCLLMVFMICSLSMLLGKNCFTMLFINTYRGFEEYNNFKVARDMRIVDISPEDLYTDDEKGVYVLVIGESETRAHMSAYGYPQATTPWLKDMADEDKAILFTQAYSCHTHTVQVLSYMLTEKNQYNDIAQASAASLVEVAKAAGYKVVWISNQVHYGVYDTPTSVIADVADQQIFINNNVGGTTNTDYVDEKLIDTLDKVELSDKTLVIFHMMGCHGAYENRYPAKMTKFAGDGDVAHYDNAVYYSDVVLERLYEKLKTVPNFQGMVYLSDHGEAVEENLGHNSAKFVPVMSQIPLFMIFSSSYRQMHNYRYQNLWKSKDKPFTNDLLYNTMSGIMGISYRGHDELQNDLSNAAYDGNIEKFRTLYGKVKIKDIN